MLYVACDAAVDIHGTQPFPNLRLDAGFFSQFALGGGQQVRITVRSTTRDLPRVAIQGVAPLTDQYNVILLVNGNDPDGGRHLHHAVDSGPPVWPDHLVFANPDPTIFVGDAR